MIRTPGLPRRPCPLLDAADVIFGFGCVVYMNDGEQSALPWSWIVRARKHFRTIEPLLNGPIYLGRTVRFERRVHPRQVGRVRLCRSHVLRRVLKRVNVDGQSVHPSISVISELPGENFVEQFLARLATLRYRCPTFRAARRECR